MQADENVNIELIQKGLRVIVPKETIVKDNANVLQKAQEYVNGIKMINEAIVDNITHKNQKIIRHTGREKVSFGSTWQESLGKLLEKKPVFFRQSCLGIKPVWTKK